ncbi:MAG: hypothetical protein WCZ72_01110 [Gemmobacter sp.]
MTIETPVGETGLPRDILSEAWDLFDFAAKALRGALRDMERASGAEGGHVRELAVATREMREALKLLVSERASVEKLRDQLGGAGVRLDFDAAGDEIGCRLACLRSAGDGG